MKTKKRARPQAPSAARSWRGIRQTVNARAMTPQGRRRLGWNALRATGSVLTIGGLIAAGIYLWRTIESPADSLPRSVNTEPLQDVVVLTDGVLTHDWVFARLGLPEGITLMEVDLKEVQATLQAEGQVRHAVVARDFPGTLVVTLEERVPVARLRAALQPDRPELLLVAPDGVVYRGFNYDAGMIARLPALDGVRLVRRGDGFAPIEGIDSVAALILAARQEAPHLLADWRVISLAELPRLVVRTRHWREIVFAPTAFRSQFAWLDFIRDFYRQRPEGPAVARIDLSIAVAAGPDGVAQVPVTFASDRLTEPAIPLRFDHLSTHTETAHRGIQR